MERKKGSNAFYIRAFKALHSVVSTAIFYLLWVRFYDDRGLVTNNPKGLWLMTCCYLLTLVIFFHCYSAYNLGYESVSKLLYSQVLAFFVTNVAFYIVSCLIFWHLINVWPFLMILALQALISLLWTTIANRLYFRLYKKQKAAVVYCSDDFLSSIESVQFLKEKFSLDVLVKNPANAESVYSAVRDCDTVFLSGIHVELRNTVLEQCALHNIRAFVIPEVSDILVRGALYMENFYFPVFNVRNPDIRIEYRFFKRCFDVIISALALVLLSPLLFITAVAVKICDGGPVLYKQIRLTRGEKTFEILKFRSMRIDAEKEGIAVVAGRNDTRITPVGKIIRACRIDELPQLINVIKGDMSIIGPRPERPEIAAEYRKQVPTFDLRLQVRAGLTGFAQVYGKYNTVPKEKLIMDLLYIHSMSFYTDLHILFRTIKILFEKESTEGFE